jgi:hypothetical protein
MLYAYIKQRVNVHRIQEFLNIGEGFVEEWRVRFRRNLSCIPIFNPGPLLRAQRIVKIMSLPSCSIKINTVLSYSSFLKFNFDILAIGKILMV